MKITYVGKDFNHRIRAGESYTGVVLEEFDGAHIFNLSASEPRIAEQAVMDFIPSVETAEDHHILDKWTAFFRSKSVPFIVTERKGRLKLWKERYTYGEDKISLQEFLERS